MDDAWSYEMDSSLQLYEPYNEFYPSKQVQLLQLWDEILLPHEKSKQVLDQPYVSSVLTLTHILCQSLFHLRANKLLSLPFEISLTLP